MIDLPGVRPRLDVDADDFLTRVFNELGARGLPTIIEHAEDLPYVKWVEERGEWIAASCPREVYEIMRVIK